MVLKEWVIIYDKHLVIPKQWVQPPMPCKIAKRREAWALVGKQPKRRRKEKKNKQNRIKNPYMGHQKKGEKLKMI